jgi:glycosyltransferase involved in cell wall biosynthesis
MPLAHIIISFFNSFLQKKCIICLHGQMEAFLEETKIGKSKYYYRLSKFVFKRNDAIDYLLFGESIKFSLLHLFDSRKKLIVIDQPYIYGELNKKLNSRRTIITLGLLGRFDQSKNVQQFFVFLDLILPEVIASKIHIKIVGRVNCEIPMQYLKYLSIYDRFLTKDEFENELSQLDFVISFTDKNFYKATPSGVFFDSIKWELPILSLKNSFLDYYFEVHGNLGMLFENTNDMVNYINRIVKDTVLLNEEKRTFKNNIKLLKSKLSIANISQNFKNQL